MANPSVRRLGALVFPGFELLDLYGPLEMFGCIGPELEIVTVAEEAGPVASTPGPATVAQFGFKDCPALDLLLVPGGIGTRTQSRNPGMLDFLRARSGTAERTLSVCTGSGLLAAAGLLENRRATSNKLFFGFARSQGSNVDWVEEARWVEDLPFVTSSGVSAGTDMALAVIATLWGESVAQRIAIHTEYEWQSDPNRDPFHQYLDQGDPQVLKGAIQGQPQDH